MYISRLKALVRILTTVCLAFCIYYYSMLRGFDPGAFSPEVQFTNGKNIKVAGHFPQKKQRWQFAVLSMFLLILCWNLSLLFTGIHKPSYVTYASETNYKFKHFISVSQLKNFLACCVIVLRKAKEPWISNTIAWYFTFVLEFCPLLCGRKIRENSQIEKSAVRKIGRKVISAKWSRKLRHFRGLHGKKQDIAKSLMPESQACQKAASQKAVCQKASCQTLTC